VFQKINPNHVDDSATLMLAIDFVTGFASFILHHGKRKGQLCSRHRGSALGGRA